MVERFFISSANINQFILIDWCLEPELLAMKRVKWSRHQNSIYISASFELHFIFLLRISNSYQTSDLIKQTWTHCSNPEDRIWKECSLNLAAKCPCKWIKDEPLHDTQHQNPMTITIDLRWNHTVGFVFIHTMNGCMKENDNKIDPSCYVRQMARTKTYVFV